MEQSKLTKYLNTGKPLLRGHFHQAAFFFFLGACTLLVGQCTGWRSIVSCLVYSVGVIALFGVSALYHRPYWSLKARAVMRRLDHSSIFLLIAGTFTPICLLGLSKESGQKLLLIVWITASIGFFQSIFWAKAPRWVNAIIYVVCGWMALPYFAELRAVMGWNILGIILAGGIIYTLGAVIYALKRPNPWPRVFGYHELFHALVVIAAGLHFWAVLRLVRMATTQA